MPVARSGDLCSSPASFDLLPLPAWCIAAQPSGKAGAAESQKKHDDSILRNSRLPLRKGLSVGCEHARNHRATPSVSHVECPTPVTI